MAAATPAGVVRAGQVADIPVVVVTEHRVHAVLCACGARTEADVPGGAPDAACCYGPNLTALVIYLPRIIGG